jgi:hypothetical protein
MNAHDARETCSLVRFLWPSERYIELQLYLVLKLEVIRNDVKGGESSFRDRLFHDQSVCHGLADRTEKASKYGADSDACTRRMKREDMSVIT